MPRLPVIANQCAHWCGNPPDEWNQVTITTKNRSISRPVGQLSIHSPSNRGIATPVCELARNDSISFQTPICRFFFLLSFPEIRENIRFTFWENLSIMVGRMQYFQPGGADIFFAKRHLNCPLSTVNCQLSHRGAIYDRAIQNSQFFHHRPH